MGCAEDVIRQAGKFPVHVFDTDADGDVELRMEDGQKVCCLGYATDLKEAIALAEALGEEPVANVDHCDAASNDGAFYIYVVRSLRKRVRVPYWTPAEPSVTGSPSTGSLPIFAMDVTEDGDWARLRVWPEGLFPEEPMVLGYAFDIEDAIGRLKRNGESVLKHAIHRPPPDEKPGFYIYVQTPPVHKKQFSNEVFYTVK